MAILWDIYYIGMLNAFLYDNIIEYKLLSSLEGTKEKKTLENIFNRRNDIILSHDVDIFLYRPST